MTSLKSLLMSCRQLHSLQKRVKTFVQVLELYEDQSEQSKINLVVQILMVSLKQQVWSANEDLN